MTLKDVIRKLTPNFLLSLNRLRKKTTRNGQLSKQKENGKSISKQHLISDLKSIGIVKFQRRFHSG